MPDLVFLLFQFQFLHVLQIYFRSALHIRSRQPFFASLTNGLEEEEQYGLLGE